MFTGTLQGCAFCPRAWQQYFGYRRNFNCMATQVLPKYGKMSTVYGTDMDTDVTLSQVDCDCLYFVLFMVRVCLITLQRWQPQRRFYDRWKVKTGLSKRFWSDQWASALLNKKLISELHGEVESIQTSWKILFYTPAGKEFHLWL